MTIAIVPTTSIAEGSPEDNDTQPLLLDVIELRSASDNLKPAQQKMTLYQRLGVRMGLLINPKNKQIEIYRPGQEPEILEAPSSIDCNEVMPGFILDMSRIW